MIFSHVELLLSKLMIGKTRLEINKDRYSLIVCGSRLGNFTYGFPQTDEYIVSNYMKSISLQYLQI